GIRLKDGRLSFPSMRGVVQFDPGEVNPVFSGKNIQIDYIQADSVLLSPGANGFTLPARTEMLQVAVSSPYFGTPYNHALFYGVRGLKTRWQLLPLVGVIPLNRLAKGEYTLELKKAAGFGNRQIRTRLKFSVKPMFYETWWFRLAAGLVAIGSLWLLFRLRLRMLVKQKERLQSEVRLATQEQQRLIENLEVAVSELERSQEELYKNTVLQEKLARIITHDLQSPLRFLSDVSERINREIKHHNTEALPELSRELQRSSAGIYRFVQDFGLWVNAKGRNFKPLLEPVLLAELAKTLQVFFHELVKRRENSLEIQIDEHLAVMADRQMMLIMLRNIIDNANKYTFGGTITVRAEMHSRYAYISVSDTGRGFSPRALARTWDQIAHPDLFEREKDADGSGYGYRFIADFIKASHIDINIVSAENQGTTVTLGRIPLAEGGMLHTRSHNTSITSI
ncbi:MAG: sensor histidine kinase, partial [Chitinophaga sp.]